jgi:hypothetical protein
VGEILNIIKKYTEALLDASKENSPGASQGELRTWLCLIARMQDKIANRSFKNLAEFRYVETTVTNQKYVHEDTGNRLNLGNASYCSVQNLLSSCLLSRNLKIITYSTV